MIQPDFSDWLSLSPYSMSASEKRRALGLALAELTHWHQEQCAEYRSILELTGWAGSPMECLEDIPFIPVRLFKELELLSISGDQVFKTMTSSGTSGQNVSRIFLDRTTAAFQTKVLTRLMSEVLGKKRLAMLVIDSPAVLRDRLAFSARGAGILGFSMFGRDVTYALDESMKLDLLGVEAFLQRHDSEPIFLFGFTFMIWMHFCQELHSRGINLPIERGILLHGGGWKKLQDQAVSNEQFRQVIAETTGIESVINYYGMVEQTGSIYLECDYGHLHAPIFSDIIIRDPIDFHPVDFGETGLIETLSLMPISYPGHALLTEDIGTIKGEDDCPCGRLGKYFTVTGRLPKAEARGCSDTYEKHS